MADEQDESISDLAELVRDDAVLQAAFVREYDGPGDAHRALDLVTGRESVISSAEHSELSRAAFGRPDPANPEVHAAALRELERLSTERAAVTAEVRRVLSLVRESPQVGDAPKPASRPANAFVLLTIALVIIVGVVSAVLLIPVPPLAVFDRPQTDEEARIADDLVPTTDELQADLSTVRILDRNEDVTFLVFRVTHATMLSGPEPGICLHIVMQDGGGGSVCGPDDLVRTTGLSGTISGSNGRYKYTWGPVGPLTFTGSDSDNKP